MKRYYCKCGCYFRSVRELTDHIELEEDDEHKRVTGSEYWAKRKKHYRMCATGSHSENSKANRIETMKGPAESGQIRSVGRRKIAKKIAKNKRCYANTLRPRSRMLLKVMKGG